MFSTSFSGTIFRKLFSWHFFLQIVLLDSLFANCDNCWQLIVDKLNIFCSKQFGFWLILQVVALGQDGRGDKSQSSQVVESVGVNIDRSQPLFYFVPHSQAGSTRWTVIGVVGVVRAVQMASLVGVVGWLGCQSWGNVDNTVLWLCSGNLRQFQAMMAKYRNLMSLSKKDLVHQQIEMTFPWTRLAERLWYESLSDVGESRVWFASKNLTPCRMHWNAFLIAQIIAKCHSFPNMYDML